MNCIDPNKSSNSISEVTIPKKLQLYHVNEPIIESDIICDWIAAKQTLFLLQSTSRWIKSKKSFDLYRWKTQIIV